MSFYDRKLISVVFNLEKNKDWKTSLLGTYVKFCSDLEPGLIPEDSSEEKPAYTNSMEAKDYLKFELSR